MKPVKTISGIILLLCAILVITACGLQSSSENKGITASSPEVSLTCADIPAYYFSLENKGTLPAYFVNDNRQIPYFDMETICTLMNSCFDLGIGYNIAMESAGALVTLTRETGSSLIIDFDADTFTFTDYDRFNSYSDSESEIDIVADGSAGQGDQSSLFSRVPEHSYEICGNKFLIDLSEYNIDLIYEKGNYYVPVQTFTDILLSYRYQYLLYNAESFFVVNSSTASDYRNGYDVPIMERYYSVTGKERTPELIEYTYNELCMVLDNFYGLKETFGINSFNEYFEKTQVNGRSMKDMLCSETSKDMDAALAQLMKQNLDDRHSCYVLSGFYTGSDQSFTKDIPHGDSNAAYNESSAAFRSVRKTYYPNGIPGYEESGNTAYITFDKFTYPENSVYDEFPTKSAKDSISLIIYAHSQITRQNSPIENVVLDLSCNEGGALDSAVFACAWFLGEAAFYIENQATDAASYTTYRCDVNLDRKYTDEDTVSDLNLYCLVSPLSFSCGNLVPAAFRASDKVTLIGQATGGGACGVMPFSTASGSMLKTSGSCKMSIIKDEAYYYIDKGMEPDVILTDIESFYDRESLTDYINSLR